VSAANAAREAALAYHDRIGLGCGWRCYRGSCPCCDAFMAGYRGEDMPTVVGITENYGWAYDAGRRAGPYGDSPREAAWREWITKPERCQHPLSNEAECFRVGWSGETPTMPYVLTYAVSAGRRARRAYERRQAEEVAP
jgi:hypothetical protein